MEDVIFKPAEHADISTLARLMRELYEFDKMAYDEQAARATLEKFLSGEMPARVWLIESGEQAIYRQFGFKEHDRYLMTKRISRRR